MVVVTSVVVAIRPVIAVVTRLTIIVAVVVIALLAITTAVAVGVGAVVAGILSVRVVVPVSEAGVPAAIVVIRVRGAVAEVVRRRTHACVGRVAAAPGRAAAVGPERVRILHSILIGAPGTARQRGQDKHGSKSSCQFHCGPLDNSNLDSHRP